MKTLGNVAHRRAAASLVPRLQRCVPVASVRYVSAPAPSHCAVIAPRGSFRRARQDVKMQAGAEGAKPAVASEKKTVTVPISEVRSLSSKALKTLGYTDADIATLVEVSSMGAQHYRQAAIVWFNTNSTHLPPARLST